MLLYVYNELIGKLMFYIFVQCYKKSRYDQHIIIIYYECVGAVGCFYLLFDIFVYHHYVGTR